MIDASAQGGVQIGPRMRTVEPTTMAERTILLIVGALIALALILSGALFIKRWPDGSAPDLIRYLGWALWGALFGLAVALLIQLSQKVGSRVRTTLGPSGLSLDIEDTAGEGALRDGSP